MNKLFKEILDVISDLGLDINTLELGDDFFGNSYKQMERGGTVLRITKDCKPNFDPVVSVLVFDKKTTGRDDKPLYAFFDISFSDDWWTATVRPPIPRKKFRMIHSTFKCSVDFEVYQLKQQEAVEVLRDIVTCFLA